MRSSAVPVAGVMPTYNEAGNVAEAIAGIHAQTHPVAKLFVVDGGSTDGTVAEVDRMQQVVDFPIETVVEASNGAGMRPACQVGAERAATFLRDMDGAGVILRTDGDSVLSRNFVAEAVTYLQQPEFVCVGAPVRPKRPDKNPVLTGVSAFLQNLDRYPKGRGMAFRAADFAAVDGYRLGAESVQEMGEQPFTCFDDTILTAKLRERGEIVFTDAACVYSSVPSTTISSVDRWKERMRLETEIGPRFDINNPLGHFPLDTTLLPSSEQEPLQMPGPLRKVLEAPQKLLSGGRKSSS